MPRSERYHYLYETIDALKTLRACALTCRAWTPRTQLHMFRILCIRCSPNTRGDINNFRSLLARAPALTSLVTTVVAKASKGENSTLHTIPIILPPLLARLTFLRLSGGLFYPALRTFPAMRRFTSVTKLSLFGVTFCSPQDLRRTVDSFKALLILEIVNIAWQPRPSSSPSSDIPTPRFYYARSALQLKELSITSDRAWLVDPRSVQALEWLPRSSILSSLTALYLGSTMILDARLLAVVELALKASARSVEHVDLCFGPEVEFSRGALHLRSNVATYIDPKMHEF